MEKFLRGWVEKVLSTPFCVHAFPGFLLMTIASASGDGLLYRGAYLMFSVITLVFGLGYHYEGVPRSRRVRAVFLVLDATCVIVMFALSCAPHGAH